MTEEPMQFAQALDRTLDHYGISAKWLSDRSGVSQQMISQFRQGRQRVYSDSLEKMVSGLPIEARDYFFKQLGSSSMPLEASIDVMNDDELANLLQAIAGKLKQNKISQQLISA